MKKIMSLWIIVVTAAAIATILLGINSFRGAIEKEFTSDIYSRLTELSVNNATSIQSKIKDQLKMMDTLATYLSEGDLRSESTLSIINKTVESYNFLRCAITFPDGSVLTHDNKNARNTAMSEYTIKGFQGISSVTGPMPAVVDPTKTVILLTVPIHREAEIIALLTFTYETNYLDNAYQITGFNGKGYSYITNFDGRIISKPEQGDHSFANDNILTFFKEHDAVTYEKMAEDMRNMDNGAILLDVDGQPKYMSYHPLGINHWYVISLTSKEVLDGQLNSVLGSVYTLSIVIIVALLLLIAFISLYIYTIQKKSQKKLQKLAYYDVLTDIPNRHLFELDARRLLDTTSNKYAYIILNVNKFKLINEIFGFPQGDKLLLHISNILREETENNEVCARFDSDIFHILSLYSSHEELDHRMHCVAEKITAFDFETAVPHTLSVGFGVYLIEDKTKPISQMGDKARMALAKIKGMHPSMTYFYNNEIIEHLMLEQEIENSMQSALDNGEMKLYLQPKCTTETSKVRGAEALVRWQNPQKGMIMPDSFIPLFEKNGFIIQLDMYMVECACKLLRRWQDNNWKTLTISVNQSRACLYQHNYIQKLNDILKKYDISPSLIEVEVTERAFFDDESALIAVIDQLHWFGFKVAMDDFGAGYSSLNMLQDVQVDVLKIDKNFFKESINSERGKKIVSNIVSMANDLDIEVVAEGIETKEQLDFLKAIKCVAVQGYYFSKPIPTDLFENTYCEPVATVEG